MSEKCFVKLLNGKIDNLLIAICVSATNAKRTDIDAGTWKLDRSSFVKIAESIIGNRFPTIQEVARACDDAGPDNRFFRLNDQFAEWIDETAPEQEVDFLIL